MARIRINTRTHTKEKPYLINAYFLSKLLRQKKSIGWAKYVFVCEWDMCWRNFCNFYLVTKTYEKWVKNNPFFKWAPFWNLIFKKRKQLRFSGVNYLNYTKRLNFACGNYIFPKTRGNMNKPWTHSTPLNISLYGGTPVLLIRIIQQNMFQTMRFPSSIALSDLRGHNWMLLAHRS